MKHRIALYIFCGILSVGGALLISSYAQDLWFIIGPFFLGYNLTTWILKWALD